MFNNEQAVRVSEEGYSFFILNVYLIIVLETIIIIFIILAFSC